MYKLMIAEDEPLERKALRTIIGKKLFNINILEDAKNGTEAIKNAKLYQPDIILMDIRMPETTGLQAQKRIIKFLPNVKTIILTAYSDFNYAQEAIKYGVADYLLKPVRPDDLKNSIDKAVGTIENSANSSSLDSSHESIMKTALNYIENNYHQEIKLNTVAELIHLNPQYFSRYFKKEMGLTFTEYITKLRIENAKKLLLETNKPNYRIAVEVGFSDPAYFNKVFLKHEKISPYKYKRKNQS